MVSEDAIDGFNQRFRERQAESERQKKAWWAGLTHAQKAEWLLLRVDPEMVFERDMPKLALAQVHATLALVEKP